VDFGVSGAVRRPGNRDSISGSDKRSSLLQTSGLALGPTWSSVRWIPGALFPAVEQPGREADHTPASRLKNESSRVHPQPHSPSRLAQGELFGTRPFVELHVPFLRIQVSRYVLLTSRLKYVCS
jgi:hypothetical protein